MRHRDGAGQEQIEDTGGSKHRKKLEVLTHDLLGAESELVDEDHRCDRCPLDHGDGLVGHAGQNGPHGLRQNDAPKRQERPHAEGGRGEALFAIHGKNTAADDLCAERGLVQHEADDGRRKTIEPDPDDRQRVVEKDELQDQGSAADEPDVGPCRSIQWRQCGEAHQSQHQTQHDAAHHCQRGDLHRRQSAIQQEGGRGVGKDLHQRLGYQAGPPPEGRGDHHDQSSAAAP